MKIEEIKQKTKAIKDVVGPIVSVLVITFLIIPNPPMWFGIAIIFASSIGLGFSLGTDYVERLLKKEDNGKRAVK